MASLSEFYRPPQTPQALTLGSGALAASDATADAGLQQSRALRQWSTQALPSMVNAASSRGTSRAGWTGLRSDWAKEGVSNQVGDIQQQLNRYLAGLRRQGVLATTGVAM